MWTLPSDSVVHATTWFLFPSKNTCPESAPRAVRPTVTLGKVVLSPVKLPNTAWYSRIVLTVSVEAMRLGGITETEKQNAPKFNEKAGIYHRD